MCDVTRMPTPGPPGPAPYMPWPLAHLPKSFQQGPALAQVHLDVEVAALLPGAVLAHDVGVRGQGRHGPHLPQAPLPLHLGPEAAPGALDGKQLAGSAVAHTEHLAGGGLANQAQELKVVVVLEQIRVDHAVAALRLGDEQHLGSIVGGG